MWFNWDGLIPLFWGAVILVVLALAGAFGLGVMIG